MQFDKNGNLYFPAHLPGSWKDLFYKYDPVSGALTEKINANICFRNAKVLPDGGIFYTGISAGDNGDCSGTSFFRYISPSNSLIQVAQNWWDFKYAQLKDPANPDTSKILFYGPNPSVAGNGWNSACLYSYDASQPSGQRTVALTECNMNLWNYFPGADLTDANVQTPSVANRIILKDRCESVNRIFLGGGEVKQLGQDEKGHVFVSATMKVKESGTFKCNVQISEDHCSSLNPTHTSAQTCPAPYAWISGSASYNDKSGSVCLVTTNSSEASVENGVYHKSNWTVSYPSCSKPNGSDGDGSSSIDGIGYLTLGSGTQNLTMITEAADRAQKFWIVDHGEDEGGVRIYYSSIREGSYALKSVEFDQAGNLVRKTLFSEFEVYHVNRSPKSKAQLMVDGLDFSSNSYTFGTVDPSLSTEEEIRDSQELIQGFTGVVKTLIFSPQFDD